MLYHANIARSPDRPVELWSNVHTTAARTRKIDKRIRVKLRGEYFTRPRGKMIRLSRLLHDGVLPHVVRPLHELAVALARRVFAMHDLRPMKAAGSSRSRESVVGRTLN